VSLPNVPAGYVAAEVRGARVVAHQTVQHAVREALGSSASLHAWAAKQSGARALQGRAVAWRTMLGDADVVVRHSRHGGLLAPITGDLFLAPRAPHELAASLRLRGAGVPTPEVLAYVRYPAGPFARVDVVTRALDGADLPDAWRAADSAARHAIVKAVATLLRELRRAGAVHPDLNLKNVFIAGDPPVAYVLDIDRVLFREADSTDAAYRNLVRFVRSARKMRDAHRLEFDDATLLEPLALTIGAKAAP